MAREQSWSPALRKAIRAAVDSGISLRHLSLSAGLVHSEVHRIMSGARPGSLRGAGQIARALEQLAGESKQQAKACTEASRMLRRALKGAKP